MQLRSFGLLPPMQVVLPLLGALLVYQYTVLIGLPPGLHWQDVLQPHLLLASHHGGHSHGHAAGHAASTGEVVKVRDVHEGCSVCKGAGWLVGHLLAL